eukprot:TRINITY_DN2409_c0_g1_i3.p1 TRINITY_DN2409_c0_g1~~TRINITY_DN2409_c0_g1_i3.p1  ORF type:complete len:301 (-),score=68.79 TRINITY_DN2409_c0_g1_i3:16-918(-)
MEAGLPPGVFNVVLGKADVGQWLIQDPDISKVSFTGSVPTGQAVMRAAALNLSKVTLELGGKSPLLIFGDTDVDTAVSVALAANFFTQGEVCTNATRVFVEEKLYSSFLHRCLHRVRSGAFRVGNPFDLSTNVGALISRAHLESVERKVESAVKDGASLVFGGKRVVPENPEIAGGFYFEPAILADCEDHMDVVKDEVFGPVMSVLKFKTEEEAIVRANATRFGLAAGVVTKDLRRAHRVVAGLNAGVCWINTYGVTPVQIPFGGFKSSGLGKENGREALDDYTRLKSVFVEMHDTEPSF